MKRIATGLGVGLIGLILVGVFIAKGSAQSVAGFSTTIGESRAPGLPVAAARELALHGGKGLILTVQQPVTLADVQALVEARRGGAVLVRVFVHAPGQDAAIALFEWTAAGGLVQRY
jgi:hypothetical protein